jgi:hypothetical protein
LVDDGTRVGVHGLAPGTPVKTSPIPYTAPRNSFYRHVDARVASAHGRCWTDPGPVVNEVDIRRRQLPGRGTLKPAKADGFGFRAHHTITVLVQYTLHTLQRTRPRSTTTKKSTQNTQIDQKQPRNKTHEAPAVDRKPIQPTGGRR